MASQPYMHPRSNTRAILRPGTTTFLLLKRAPPVQETVRDGYDKEEAVEDPQKVWEEA